MPHRTAIREGSGPFRTDQIRPGDPYELSNGHAIYCVTTGGSGARGTVAAAEVIDTDPAVRSAGVDAGFTQGSGNLRAPDVAVDVPDAPGWVQGVPPLAVEIADRGQDEQELRQKIGELLQGGTRFVWVVRLKVPRHVEVHEPGKAVRKYHPGELLTAPGILQNAVPVEAMWDRGAAHEATLRNLLQRQGYENLDAVRQEGRDAAGSDALADLRSRLLSRLSARGIVLSEADAGRVAACTEFNALLDWIENAVTATDAKEIFGRTPGRLT